MIRLQDKIFQYILTNEYINGYFKDIALSRSINIEEFKQHIYVTIFEKLHKDSTVIERLFNEGNLGKYVMGVIKKQLLGNSPYYYQTALGKKTNHIDNWDDEDITSDEDNDEDFSLEHKKKVANLINALNHIRPEDAVIFKLYYGINPITNELTNPKTLKQVQDTIGVNYETVRYSIAKTLGVIKKMKF